VLLINKAEAGKLEFNPVPLNLLALCRELVEDLQLTAKTQHSISFVYLGSYLEACLDEKLLRQILTNLLSNAVKYSPEGGNVQFDLIFGQETVTFRSQIKVLAYPQKSKSCCSMPSTVVVMLAPSLERDWD
jgi:signal transduction histidine kinase